MFDGSNSLLPQKNEFRFYAPQALVYLPLFNIHLLIILCALYIDDAI